jgi:hypothetical protein
MMAAFEPLHFPVPWPPPDLPLLWPIERFWRSIPIAGWIIAHLIEIHRLSPHRKELEAIESQITRQLLSRSTCEYWAKGSEHYQLARLLAEAVGKEKGLPAVSIHPDDPIEVLLWGAEDDMSALRFALELQERCEINLSIKDFQFFFANHLTASEVIAYCWKSKRVSRPATFDNR